MIWMVRYRLGVVLDWRHAKQGKRGQQYHYMMSYLLSTSNTLSNIYRQYDHTTENTSPHREPEAAHSEVHLDTREIGVGVP